jgi:hypothetical protein
VSWAIDDQYGTELAAGIATQAQAVLIAHVRADALGEPVYIYDAARPDDASMEIEPADDIARVPCFG